MIIQGRHRVYALIWPWEFEPFFCEADIAGMSMSKSVSQGQSLRLSLYPRAISARARGSLSVGQYRYMDILNPNDWVFLFVDPGDGDNPAPLFLGFIDTVMRKKAIGQDGMITRAVEVSCSGWEKAIRQVTAITSPFVALSINGPTLRALGPMGWRGNSRTMTDWHNEPNKQDTRVGPIINTLPALVELLVAIYLRSDDSQGLELSDPTVDINRASRTEDDADMEEHDWYGGHRDTGQANPIFSGQFTLPGIDRPLWDFIRMRFEDLQQRVYVSSEMFLNGITKSLASLIDEVSNPVMNEIFYDVRDTLNDGLASMEHSLHRRITGGYSQDAINEFVSIAGSTNEDFQDLVEHIAPYMVLRLRPLFPSEINDLSGPTMNEYEAIDISVGKSDSDLHNMTTLDFPNVNMQLIRSQSGFQGFQRYRERSLESIRRHGLRFYQESCGSWPMQTSRGEITAPLPSAELGREWEIRLSAAGLDNIAIYSGTVIFPRYIRDLNIGGKLRIVPSAIETQFESDPVERIYYVDSLDYNYDPISGKFITNVSVSRGYPVSDISERGARRDVVAATKPSEAPILSDGAK